MHQTVAKVVENQALEEEEAMGAMLALEKHRQRNSENQEIL